MKQAEERPLTRREKREIIENQRAKSANFDRGRTISGVKKEKSERMERRKLIVRRRKISGFLAFLCVVAFLAMAILTQLVVKIEISLAGKKLDAAQSKEYVAIIEEYYRKQPIERLRGYLKKGDLLADLQKSHPEIKDISKISLSGIGRYAFEIQARTPVASWDSSGKTLYVDSEGVSFSKNYFSHPDLKIVDEGAVSANEGKNVASNAFMSFVGKTVSSLASKNLKVSKIVIPPTSLRQVNIYIEGVKYPAKMLIASSAEGQSANLAKAIGYFQKNGLNPEYVDLRVEGKGYFK